MSRFATLFMFLTAFGVVTIIYLTRTEISIAYKFVLLPFIYYYGVTPKALPTQDCTSTSVKVQWLHQKEHSLTTVSPKVIHQSWKRDELPKRFAGWQTSWRRCYPASRGWNHILWTDKDNRCLVQEYLPWFLPHYDSLPGDIYRVDAVRFVYLYLFGGIYTDLDTECLRPFDHLFTKNMRLIFVGMDSNKKSAFAMATHFLPNFEEGWVQNSFMIARVKRHSMWLELLHRIVKRVDYGPPELLTGTGALMKVIQKHREEALHDNSTEQQNDLAIFPAKYFNPFSWVDNEFTSDCKALNQMSQEDLHRCRSHFVNTSYVIQYHSQTWGRGEPL